MAVGYCYVSGNRKSVNEDALVFRQSMLSNGPVTMLALSDGMGGMEYGKEASTFCIKEVDLWFDRELIPALCTRQMTPLAVKKVIRHKGNLLFRKINESLFLSMRFEKKQMGTTLVLVILYRNFYYVLHIGDSRAYLCFYLFSKNYYIPLTTDHKGTNGEWKAGISKCLGLNKEWKPDCSFGYIRKSGVLLCSDGFYKRRTEGLWERCLHKKAMKNDGVISKRLSEIAQYNMKHGEMDNISAIIYVN